MSLTRTAAILAGAAAFAALVVGAATSSRDVPRPVTSRPTAIDLRGADLAKEVTRLHERLRPDATPRQPARNLFSFNAARRVHTPVVAEARVEAPASAAPAPVPFKLVGIGEDAGPSGPIRTAFISGEGQLFIAKEGDAITPRFKVTKIAADVAEITDVMDGSTRRLALR